MKVLLIIVGLILTFSSCIINQQSAADRLRDELYDTAYDEYLEKGETKILSWYQSLSSNKNNQEYILRLFYPEKKQITFLKTYKYKNRNILHGWYGSWSDNGNKMSEGNYKENLQDGVWKFYYYQNEQLSSEGKYQNGKKEGLWKSYDMDGTLTKENHWQEGLKEGLFIVYDSLGNKVNEGVYKADAIVQQSKTKEELYLDELNFPGIEEMPYLKDFEHITNIQERKKASDQGLLKYIYGTIRYPVVARENATEGKALISFTVAKDGSIQDIYTISGICEGIEEECLRIVNNMPQWNPGKQKGKPVQVKYTLPIQFKLT